MMEVSIRFAGIGNKHGSLMATSDQDGLIPPFNEHETSHYATQPVLRVAIRKGFERKISKLEYSIRRYQQLIRATIPFKQDDEAKLYLLISFDAKSSA
jgi:hypothetical protein